VLSSITELTAERRGGRRGELMRAERQESTLSHLSQSLTPYPTSYDTDCKTRDKKISHDRRLGRSQKGSISRKGIQRRS
jgi:hypothetical protein